MTNIDFPLLDGCCVKICDYDLASIRAVAGLILASPGDNYAPEHVRAIYLCSPVLGYYLNLGRAIKATSACELDCWCGRRG